MKVELKALLRQFSELSRMLADPAPMAPPEAKALGVDPVLPDGWSAEAHRTGRSPWDAELPRPRQLVAVRSFLRDTFESPTQKTTSAPEARVAPDRRPTETDWGSNPSDEAS
jgi:hypothetical protein